MKHIISSLRKWYNTLFGAVNDPHMRYSSILWEPKDNPISFGSSARSRPHIISVPDDHELTNVGTLGFYQPVKLRSRPTIGEIRDWLVNVYYQIAYYPQFRSIRRHNDKRLERITGSASSQDLAYMRKEFDKLPPQEGIDLSRYKNN